MELKKINEQTNQKQTHRHREQTDGCLVGGGFEGLGKNGKGIKKYKLVIAKQSWGYEYSIGNTVNDIVVTMCGAIWVLEILGGPLVKYMMI